MANKLSRPEVLKRTSGHLNQLQQAQLLDCINAGRTVKVNQVPRSMNKGFDDTPLFENKKQRNLFE